MSHAPAPYAATAARPAYPFPAPEQQVLWSEARLGQECGFWLQWYHRAAYDCFFHVPNGGLRTAREAAALQAQHVKRGVPDYFLAVSRTGLDTDWCAGLFIELKTATGRVAPEQLTWHTRLRAQGYQVEIIRSLPEFVALLTAYLN